MRERRWNIMEYLQGQFASTCEHIALSLATTHEGCSKSRSTPYCRYSRKAATKYLVQFSERGLWPSYQMWLPSTLAHIKEFKVPRRNPPTSSCERDEIVRLDFYVRMRKNDLSNLWLGLCLDCVKSEGQSTLGCRAPHGDYFQTTLKAEQAHREYLQKLLEAEQAADAR